MVEDRITDGKRIAQLLASEIRGREDGPLGALSITDVQEAEATPGGEFAYSVERDDGPIVADAYVHPEWTLLKFRVGLERALELARERDLRARPRDDGETARTIVFVDSGADVKDAVDVFRSLGSND